MIRAFSDDDAGICRQIIRECFEKTVTLEEKMKQLVKEKLTSEGWLEKQAKKKSIFVYERNGKILGMGCLAENIIEKVYVDPEMHGKGVGSEILLYLESLAKEQGCEELTLYSLPNSRMFYRNKGYKETGVHYYNYPDNIRIPMTIMTKNMKL